MGTFVTLSEVLEARGSPLEEEEVWCLLLACTETLLEISSKGNMCSILSPGSVLLSVTGSLAFKNCGRSADLASFTAPEVQQGHIASRTATEKLVVFSLGMTLYWCAVYHLPQNQPVHLSSELEGLLLSMCEDMALKRTDLLTVLEICKRHYQASLLPPPDRLVKQLVEDVRDSVDSLSLAGNGSQLIDRSQVIRDRLHKSFNNSTWALRTKLLGGFSGTSYLTEPTGITAANRHKETYSSWQQLAHSPCNPYMDCGRHPSMRSLAHLDSTTNVNEKKLKNMGPEFIRMLDEPSVILELPGSIVSKKGKCATAQREVRIVMPSSQIISIKCAVTTRGGDIFDMIVAHSNLVEHCYFGLSYIDDNEFFFLDKDIKISKVAPHCWKKVPAATFVLFFRVKFFISDISQLLHKMTRHQYYLQLRKDLLENRLCCHEGTALYLGALALQAEYGDCIAEVYGRNYYRPDQYVPKSMMEKHALPYIQEELLRLHSNNTQMLTDESELEFLKVSQHLPEYGVLFYRVVREKKPTESQIILGVCAKGVIVYEVKDGCRSASQTFCWRDTASISSNRRKFTIECRSSRKKYSFITERSKVAKYLCKLCSDQHKFHNEMNSRQRCQKFISEDSILHSHCNQFKAFPCPEMPQDNTSLALPHNNTSRLEAHNTQQHHCQEQSTSSGSQRSSIGMHSPASSQKRDTPNRLASSEREVICLTLKKDPKLGLGIVIVGEDTVGQYDLGIFVASIVAGGPADKDGRIRPGGRLISLNHTSLEGVTFSEAAEVMQSSPEQVQLVVAQPKAVSPTPNNMPHSIMLSNISSHTPPGSDSLEEIMSVVTTPKTGSRLNLPRNVYTASSQDGCSGSSSLNCLKPKEVTVELRKNAGTLGISISAGSNTNLIANGGIYIKSLVPGGAAERDGRVRKGDRLVEVDGMRFDGFTYQQAVDCLTRTGEVVTLVLEREALSLPTMCVSPNTGSSVSLFSASPDCNQLRNNICPAIACPYTSGDKPRDYRFITDDNTLEVTLKKGTKGLGFSFLMCDLDPTGRELGSLVRIKQLFPGQPAYQSGRIQEGDVILAINGQPVKTLTYPVLQLFKNSSEIRLDLCRPALGVLPPIEQFT